MPRKELTTMRKSFADAGDAFLRSINLCYDSEQPERIAHFYPTSKCVALMRALLGHEEDRACFVVAPYGSGKSLTATYLLHLIENRADSHESLKRIEPKLMQVSPDLGEYAAKRRRARRDPPQGLVLALHGYSRSVPESLRDAALDGMRRLKLGRQARPIREMPCTDMDDAIKLLIAVQDKCAEAGCDQVAVIWDEFGRHVESLIADGRPAALSDLQTLAEFASRSTRLPLMLGLLLHQGLLHYASNISQSVRAEWTKIEGRFRTIQYVDDSKEIYRLIAEVAGSRSKLDPPSDRRCTAMAKDAQKHRLFGEFTQKELSSLLSIAYPLEPATLHLLPKISARVAQNERTLFSFLYGISLDHPIAPDRLYDFFSEAMRADTAVGGTHRQWLEAESAISKVAGEAYAEKALKTACLLGLGVNGQRSRAGRELLQWAIAGYDRTAETRGVVDLLVERKLLLHRQHNDEVSIWHGTDADLRGRLEEEKRRWRDGFNLLDFLGRDLEPPAWRPSEYNDDYRIRRYFTGEFHNLEQLESYLNFELQLESVPVDCDGKVLYLVGETAEELERGEQIAREHLQHQRVVLALPREPLPLTEAAVEVWSLLQMQQDSELVGSDPLILPELQQMTDDARGHLQRMIDRLLWPASDGPRWFHRGEEFVADDARDLRHQLSEMMRDVYHLTPAINNEMIVRKKPSPTLVNSRKKLNLGILERAGTPSLGLEGNTPDVSMFRTVLWHTGLYRHDGERTGFAAPHAIEDPGLRAVWENIRDFLTLPSESPKRPADLIKELQSPPIGLRAGVIPILIAAGFKAFPSAISLMKGGEYITDILPSVIEDLCRKPEAYRLMVLDLDETKLAYLREIHRTFSAAPTYEVAERDLIRLCYDAIEAWKTQLPPAALTTRRVSETAQRFQRALQRPADPVNMLLQQMPSATGIALDSSEQVIGALRACKRELEGVAGVFAEQAAQSIHRTLGLGSVITDASARNVARQWAECFPDRFIEQLRDQAAKGLLTRMRTEYDTDQILVNSLAHLLLGRPLSRWDDSTVHAFDRELQTTVRRIEETALASETALDDSGSASLGLSELVAGRVDELFHHLVRLVGEGQARTIIESKLFESSPGAPYGDA
mgnify:CR=1 FL=1